MKQRRRLTLLASHAQIQPVFNFSGQFSFDRYGEFASIDKQVYILEIQILLCWEGRQGYGYHIEAQLDLYRKFCNRAMFVHIQMLVLTTLGAFQGRDFADLEQCPFSLCFVTFRSLVDAPIQPLSQKSPNLPSSSSSLYRGFANT